MEVFAHVATGMIQGKGFKEAFRNIDWADVAISAGEGALFTATLGMAAVVTKTGGVIATKAGAAALRTAIDVKFDDGINFELVGHNKSWTNVLTDAASEGFGYWVGSKFKKTETLGGSAIKRLVRSASKKTVKTGVKIVQKGITKMVF